MELCLPARDRDVAAHQADPRQRHRLDHAGRRSRRPRSQRRLVLQGARRAGAPAPAPAAGGRRRRSAPAGGRGGAGLPYWGKYVFHDNNRDINLSQVSMRALVDWYFTAHPPIMHDLHEAQPLLYTYSGGPPQNPNLDPILFAELPFFSNFELAQMTKYGMPGVYTHAFMDGWSPGYLGSVAYNHNGMMRMYETQSGRESGPARVRRVPAGATRCRTTAAACRCRAGAAGATVPATAPPARRRRCRRRRARRRCDAARRPRLPTAGAGRTRWTRRTGRGGAAAATRRGGSAPARGGGAGRARRGRGRRWSAADARRGRRRAAAADSRASGIAACRFRPTRSPTSRAATTPTTWRPACCPGLQLTSMFPNLVIENFYKKTQHSIDAGKTEPPYGYVIPGEHQGHDARRRRSSTSCARSAIEIGAGQLRDQDRRRAPSRPAPT